MGSSTVSPSKERSGRGEVEIKRRVRTRHACESCRRRRRKCNGRFPCAHCIGYSYRCEYVGGQPDNPGDQTLGFDPENDANLDFNHSAGNRGPEHVPETSQHIQQGTSSASSTEVVNDSQPQDIEMKESRKPNFRPTVDIVKGRFSNAHSSILLPRRIGQTMDLDASLRFHSYGWNVNTRLEPAAFLAPAVCRLLTFHDLHLYSRVFFDVVDPIYHFIDQQKFLDQCSQYWATENQNLGDIEAVVSGVVALGSFFSEIPSPVESSLIEHAKQILDLGCAYAPGRISLNQVAGWILRTLYLRLTTRPHLCWYASCSTMHVVEAMGLHVDLRDVDVVTRDSDQSLPECTSTRSGLFECALFLNSIISAEYGRSRVILQDATEPSHDSDSQLMRLSAILLCIEVRLTQDARLELLSCLHSLPAESPVFALLKTDVTIHLFRRHLYPHQENISLHESRILLSILEEGLHAARELVPLRRPWWNVISTPFQSLMVILAIDTDESLSRAGATMSVLGLVYSNFPTHLAAEVVQTARMLIQGLEKRKVRQARMLSKAYGETSSLLENQASPTAGAGRMMEHAEAVFENWLTGDMNWHWLPTGNCFAHNAGRANVDTL